MKKEMRPTGLKPRFSLKCVREMTRIYSQLYRTDKYSERSSIIWPVWPNGWVFDYKLSGSGFESSCSHLNFRICACFEQGVPWHSDNYRVWIHSETRTWHDKNIHCGNGKLLRQHDSPFISLFTIWFTQAPEKYFVKLCNTCYVMKFQDISIRVVLKKNHDIHFIK